MKGQAPAVPVHGEWLRACDGDGGYSSLHSKVMSMLFVPPECDPVDS